MKEYSEHDLDLVIKARHTPWEFMDELIDKCESEIAKNEIREMQRSQFHIEND